MIAGICKARTLDHASYGTAGMFTLFVLSTLRYWMDSTGVVGTMISASVTSKVLAPSMADGISSSDVSPAVSQYAVAGLHEVYYCTSVASSVKTPAEQILNATHHRLHSQTRKTHHRHDKDEAYVYTLTALILKSTTAPIFHVGDSCIYRLRGGALEQLTSDHRGD